jgi:hypothetical protein
MSQLWGISKTPTTAVKFRVVGKIRPFCFLPSLIETSRAAWCGAPREMTEGTTSRARVQSAFKAGSPDWAPQTATFNFTFNSEIIIIGLKLSDLWLCWLQIGLCKMYRKFSQRSPSSPCFKLLTYKIFHTKLPAVRACACMFFIPPYVIRLDSIFMTMRTEAKH